MFRTIKCGHFNNNILTSPVTRTIHFLKLTMLCRYLDVYDQRQVQRQVQRQLQRQVQRQLQRQVQRQLSKLTVISRCLYVSNFSP